MQLQYPLVYVFVSMNRMKASVLDELESGVLSVVLLTRTFCRLHKWETDIDLETTPAHHTCIYPIRYCVADIDSPLSR